MGGLSLLAWGLGLPQGPRAAELIAMNPLSDVGLVLAGISLWLFLAGDTRQVQIARSLAWILAVLGALKFAEFLFDFNLDPGRLVFPSRLPHWHPTSEIAPNSALNLLLSGVALGLLDRETRRGLRPAQVLFLIAGLISMLALIGHAYRVLSLYRVGSSPPMALVNAMAFAILSFSGLAARPDQGIMRVITSSTSGGTMARRLLPLAILVPWVLGGLRLLEEEIGLYQTGFGISVFATGSIVVFAVFIWWNARLLYHSDLTQAQTRRCLDVQYHSTNLLAKPGSLAQALPEILESLSRSIECNAAAIWRVNHDRMHCLEMWHTPSPELDAFEQGTRSIHLAKGEGLIGKVWATTQPIWTEDLPALLHPASTALAVKAGLRGALAYPISVGNDVVGAIEFYCTHVQHPDRNCDEMLAAVASQIGQRIERDRAEEQLRGASANLQRSNTDLQQFASLASHDLSEPLRMVISYLDLLKATEKDKLGPASREFIAFAIDGAQRMQTLINDLLAYSRVDTSGRSLKPTDLEQVLAGATRNLKVAIEESGAVVTHEPLPMVQGDASQLAQLLQNLIGNAIKFRGPNTPRVDIRAERSDADWILRVTDNGIGIDPKNYEVIFVIFQRLHTRQEYPGTGMGLAICKRIIERHGGRIWVEPGPGRGTTFAFSLRAARNGSS